MIICENRVGVTGTDRQWLALADGRHHRQPLRSKTRLQCRRPLLMALAFWMYAIAVALTRVRAIILERERHTEWVKEVLK